MSEERVQSTPRLEQLLAAQVSPDRQSVEVLFQSGERRFSVRIANDMVLFTAGTLLSMASVLPPSPDPSSLTLQARKMELATEPGGGVALTFELEGASRIAVQLPAQDLPILFDQISLAMDLAKKKH